MSTRSNIIAKTKDGYKRIYCHHDGYPEHVSSVLRDYYDEEEVEWLFEKGDMSSLGLPFQERKWGDDYDAEKCVFYRSRGEAGIDAKPVDNEYFMSMKDSWIDYYYFFDGKEWFGIVNTPNDGGRNEIEFRNVGLKVIDVGEVMKMILG